MEDEGEPQDETGAEPGSGGGVGDPTGAATLPTLIPAGRYHSRARQIPSMEVVRELNEGDITALAEAPPAPTTAPLSQIRAIHHAQARLLAAGKTPAQVAVMLGTSPQRVRLLMDDPAFVELVNYYHDQAMVEYLDDQRRINSTLVDVAELAVNELQTRLSDEKRMARIPTSEIRKISEFALDRTVAPPKGTAPTATAPVSITLKIGDKTPIDPDIEPKLTNAVIIENEEK